MDETAVWADMVAETMVDRIGQKEIAVKSSGHEKVGVTVCLAAQADSKRFLQIVSSIKLNFRSITKYFK